VTVAWLVAAAVVGYACGAVSPATILARRFATDLRASGSGNPGATNVGRVLGVRWGVLVALLDVAKGLVPAAGFALVGEGPGLVGGAAAVLGHVSSPFLRGRGGRGVATSLGAILGVKLLWAVPVLLAFGVVAVLTRWVALGSVAAAVALVVTAAVADASVAARIWGVGLATVVLLRHRATIVAALRRVRRGPRSSARGHAEDGETRDGDGSGGLAGPVG